MSLSSLKIDGVTLLHTHTPSQMTSPQLIIRKGIALVKGTTWIRCASIEAVIDHSSHITISHGSLNTHLDTCFINDDKKKLIESLFSGSDYPPLNENKKNSESGYTISVSGSEARKFIRVLE